jgi:hypothetical protein
MVDIRIFVINIEGSVVDDEGLVAVVECHLHAAELRQSHGPELQTDVRVK